MKIILSIGLLPDGSDELTGFSQFWLRYVHGFSPKFHCQKSLLGISDKRFSRHMRIGKSFELREPDDYNHIYLCGVTSKKYPGLHFALLPEEGTYSETETYNGIKISVRNAKELGIPYLPDGYAGMSHSYTSCRNWQFGVEYYGLDKLKLINDQETDKSI